MLLFITSYYFATIATALWSYYVYLGYSIPAVVALIHVIAQFGCVSMNPADPNVRGRDLTVSSAHLTLDPQLQSFQAYYIKSVLGVTLFAGAVAGV